MNWRVLATLGALAGLFYGGWAVRGYVERADDLRAAVASLQSDLASERKTALAVRKYYAERDAIKDSLDAQAREFQSMEGRDAPLSDHLRGVAGRLWP